MNKMGSLEIAFEDDQHPQDAENGSSDATDAVATTAGGAQICASSPSATADWPKKRSRSFCWRWSVTHSFHLDGIFDALRVLVVLAFCCVRLQALLPMRPPSNFPLASMIRRPTFSLSESFWPNFFIDLSAPRWSARRLSRI